MTEARKVPTILWCDLETTGLNAESGLILEMGFRLTDYYGSEIRRWTHVLWSPLWRATLARNQFVWDMHVESGLVAELTRIDSLAGGERIMYAPHRVRDAALAWLEEHAKDGPHDGKFPMAGNSLSGVDRPFLVEHAPAINAHFSYRNLDVSSIREACRIVNPALHAREPQLPKAHRTQQDLDNTILLWQHYIDNFFFEE